jgi:hypothetical protein
MTLCGREATSNPQFAGTAGSSKDSGASTRICFAFSAARVGSSPVAYSLSKSKGQMHCQSSTPMFMVESAASTSFIHSAKLFLLICISDEIITRMGESIQLNAGLKAISDHCAHCVHPISGPESAERCSGAIRAQSTRFCGNPVWSKLGVCPRQWALWRREKSR